MCKNPASDCKPPEVDNAQAEDNVMSEDESEPTDTDESYFTESSVDNRTESESDGESASGNRVTPEMILMLMLKQHGAITDEKYAEKAEKCTDNIKHLIPKIPRSDSLDTIDYTRDIEEDSNDEASDDGGKLDADKNEKLLQGLIGDSQHTIDTANGNDVICNMLQGPIGDSQHTIDTANGNNFVCDTLQGPIGDSQHTIDTAKGNDVVFDKLQVPTADSQHVIDTANGSDVVCDTLKVPTADSQHTIETANANDLACHTNVETNEKDRAADVESIEKVKEDNISDLIDPNTWQDSKERCDGELILQPQGTITKVRDNELYQEEMKELQQDQILLNVNEQEPYQGGQQDTATYANKPSENPVDKSVNEASSKDCGKNSDLECTSSANTVTKVEIQKSENTKDMEIMLIEIDTESSRQFKMESNLEFINGTNIESNNNAGQDPLIKTDKEARKEDLTSKNEFNQTTGKLTKSFRYILNKLVRENRIPEEDEEDRISYEYGQPYAMVLRSYVRTLDDHYGPNMTASRMSVSDDDDDDDGNLKEFALFLNFYSPSSYKYILETFNTPLPEHKVLCSWYLKEDNEPGLSERAFKILKQKSSEKRLTCSLMFIDIFLKNHGRYYDQVDYGGGPNYDCEDRAVLAYVFVLVSLDEEWKMPIGYIYARNVPAETQAELIRVCLTQCHDAGADVVAVTLETLTPAEFLGCSFQDPKKLRTTFKHPVCDRDVAVWIDPCLAIKSARQTLKIKGSLEDDKGNKVRWNLIRKLRRLHSDDVIDFEKPEFFELRNHIAKVGLTTEIFSNSLASALELSEELLPDLFMETEPTRRYIFFINMIYSILNSRVTTRMRHVMHRLQVAKIYLTHIFCNEENGLSPFDRVNLAWGTKRKGYRYFLKGESACGFLGFLICIESFKHLYNTLIKKEKRFRFLNPQRLCKVQAEDFVTTLRVHSGWDPEYYSGESLQSYLNTFFNALEKNPLFSDKSLSLEHWRLKDRYTPAVIIKLTSGKRSYDDIYSAQYKMKKLRTTSDENRATKVVRKYSRALDIEKDPTTRKNMVGFISSWIAAKFAKCLRCEECIDALCTEKKLWFHKFIFLKRIYAVCLSSEELFRICWECERALRTKRTPASIRACVLRRLMPKFPWGSRVAKHPSGHRIQLARAVIAKYVPLRIPVPLSSKENTRIIDMFRRFTSKDDNDSYDELAEWMDSSSEEEEDKLY